MATSHWHDSLARTRAFALAFTCLAFLLFLTPHTLAQAQTVGVNFFGDYQLQTRTQRGLLRLTQSAPGSNVFTGSAFGQSIAGYYAPNAGQAVWIESINSVPARVYVAAVAAGRMNGVMYALNTPGGATNVRNTFAFTANRAALPSLLPPADPAVPGAATLLPSTAAWFDANGYVGALVLNVNGAGNVTGWVFGDRIEGHYAQSAGVLAFLRFQNNKPIQFFQGNVMRAGGGAQPTLNGTFYALNEAAGASPDVLEFSMRSTSGSPFISYRFNSAANHCLEADWSAPNIAAPIVSAACGRSRQQMSLIADFDGFRHMVLQHSGLCLSVNGASAMAGAGVQQTACNSSANQRLIYRTFNAGDLFQLQFAHSGFCIAAGAPVPNTYTRAVVQEACNRLTSDNAFVAQ